MRDQRTTIVISAPSFAALPGTARAALVRLQRSSYRRQMVAILGVALLQGLIYLLLLPPWQHYDEPTHFEYAWLIATTGRFPSPADGSQTLRRELAASMIAHRFYTDGPPALLTDSGEIWIGWSELGHPPGYYALVSLPLMLVSHLDLVSQLYVARSVSLLLFLLTIAVAGGVARDLTGPGHPLRWGLPLALALLPPFVDLMTSVNNDVGATLALSLLSWGAVRTIRYGLTWRRLGWLVGAALLGATIKNTAMIGLACVPVAVILALWVARGWRWRWLGLSVLLLAVAPLVLLFGWGNAAYWYRFSNGPQQALPTRVRTPAAPVGAHALQLEVTPAAPQRELVAPLLDDAVRRLAGRTVTVGGWLWASRPATISAPGLRINTADTAHFVNLTQPISVTTTPRFVAHSYALPADTRLIQQILPLQLPSPDAAPLQVFLDGALLVEGSYTADQLPLVADADARAGEWHGQPFSNALRNASAEQSWPRPRARLDDLALRYMRHQPSQILLALLDIQRTGGLLVGWSALTAFDGLVERFAWSQVRLESRIWVYLLRGWAALALVGVVRWLWCRRHPTAQQAAVLWLALLVTVVWALTIVRPLPLLDVRVPIPVTRYTFPAVIATLCALVGGWQALWPRPLRSRATLLLIGSLCLLNIVSILTIWSFYQAA